MFAVIADDLTGAAEIGGIGLKYGYTVEIITGASLKTNADMLVIATDTRSMPEARALAEMTRISRLLQELKPDHIFKKVDSVLRGHVIAELKAHLEHLHLKRALLVPANPALGRTLTRGHYYIEGLPIHLSSFADDPEFAIKSSGVHDMLRVQTDEVHSRTHHEEFPASGIIVGSCEDIDDLSAWAIKYEEDVLPAGSSGFFKAILEGLGANQHAATKDAAVELGEPALFVCGSTFDNSRRLVAGVYNNGGPVSYMPARIMTMLHPPENLYEEWANEIASLLAYHKRAIIAVCEGGAGESTGIAGSLRDKKAIVVDKVLKKIAVKELLIEGGATATAIITKLRLNRFRPVAELSTGVIRMKAVNNGGFYLTLKPGSYSWPVHVWNF